MKNNLLNSKLGQHLTEFLILFLALSVAFVGTRMYLRRGVNAKLKHIEMQLNDSIGAEGFPPVIVPPIPVHIEVRERASHGMLCYVDTIWSVSRWNDFDRGGSTCPYCIQGELSTKGTCGDFDTWFDSDIVFIYARKEDGESVVCKMIVPCGR